MIHSPADVFGKPADAWDPARSLALGELAQLAYEDATAWRITCSRAGWAEADFVDVGPTEVGVAATESGVVVAARGTNSLLDAVGDVASIVRRPWRPWIKGAVGYGFKRHAKRSINGLGGLADDYSAYAKEVWIVGHSLAGAMAPLMRAVLAGHGVAVTGTKVFNSPRVGGKVFCAWYDSQWRSTSWRVVNVVDGLMDKVSRVPWRRAGFGDYGRLVIFQGARPPFEDDFRLTHWNKIRERVPVGWLEGALKLWRTRTTLSAHSMAGLAERLARLQEMQEAMPMMHEQGAQVEDA